MLRKCCGIEPEVSFPCPLSVPGSDLSVAPPAEFDFVPFIMITTFAVVNLLVGLIVNSMQDAHHEVSNAETDAHRVDVSERLLTIEQRLDALLKSKDR